MNEKDIQNALFFMDNLQAHKIFNLYKFYNKKKLFNVPNVSEFNTRITAPFRFAEMANKLRIDIITDKVNSAFKEFPYFLELISI